MDVITFTFTLSFGSSSLLASEYDDSISKEKENRIVKILLAFIRNVFCTCQIC